MEKQLNMMKEINEKCLDEDGFIKGFDLVCEEEKCEQLNHFCDDIMKVKKYEKDHFPIYLHAGETIKRHSENLYDAILMGTKRIGHGFNLV